MPVKTLATESGKVDAHSRWGSWTSHINALSMIVENTYELCASKHAGIS
jgi:hypothetical protein